MDIATPPKKTLWSRARAMAEAAPPTRNRYVDFLRAFSILAVVVGHWLVAAPYMKDGAVEGGHLLGILPWTQWLTWGFQVMPLFFLVGGFSNGLSWAATQRNGGRFTTWFAARVRRLINPVLPLLLIWALVTLFGTQAGIDRTVVKMATQLALVPVWFLAVYLIVTALTPWSHAAWRRFGLTSFFALVAAAVVIDIATLQYGIPYVNFLNFVFVWVAIHQLGYAWHDGRIAAPLLWAAAGLVALGLLVGLGPYPVAMIGVPGAELSNSMPPTLALLALGIAQTGLALVLEKPARAMLDGLTAWTTVVLINGMIMTVYLWHLTAFVLVMVAAWLLGGIGLHVEPGSTAWWLARPIWFLLYIALLFPFILLFARYESGGKAAEGDVTHARLILGMLMICTGLAMTAAISIASPLGVTGVRLWVVALPFLGAALVGFGPAARLLMRRVET
ncbi:acyltransferase [Sphingopyxis sp. OPL5]|uniref:acyltransferase family protein n=1 Tax=Sphingopyxis sp. OPL5 TaxID=2486273 RepID=UPI00164EB54A|nr:acyltransferase [Sphingopyxis sp. OPL5]QNO28462.1 acyltransferase [Sphingopyxis sp. OPL5]